MEVSLFFILQLFIGFIILLTIWHYYCRVSIPSLRIKNSNILITGGSEGIGFSLAKACIKAGANVAILARNKQKLSNAHAQLTKLRPNKTQQVLTISADVSDYNSMQQAITTTLSQSKWTSIDALICNAGVEQVSLMEDTSLDTYHRIMNINYFGVVNTIKICLNLLKREKTTKKPGRIIINCSLLGIMSMAYYSAYSSSKWALRGFVESIYSELAADNIYTSIVYPPDVKTKQLEREKQVDIPKAVREISGDSGVFEPDVVGQDMMNMLINGEYCKTWGMDGWMLLNETAGFSVTWSLQDTLTQVMGMGLFRAIGMWYIQNIYNVCKKSIAQEKTKKDN